MEGHREEMEGLLAFPVVRPDPPGLEVRVNFGIFAGRQATQAEIEELAAALLPDFGDVEIVNEQRFEFTPGSEAEVSQVKIEVSRDALPVDDLKLGELGGRLASAAERWARACIAERHAEVSEL
jgi:hypothetical protein